MSLVTVFTLRSDISIATLTFFWFPFAWKTFFYPLTFSLYVSLDLKWISCRQHIYGSCFCIHSATLCLLIGAFSLFTFMVIIDMYAILLIVWGLFHRYFLFLLLLSSLVVWWLFIFMFWFLFLFCVCIYYRFLVGDCCEVFIQLYIYNCFKLLISYFQMHFSNLPLVLSSPHKFLISYFISNCFVYPLTAYCGYRWFYYFCLLTLLLALYMVDLLPLLYICLLMSFFHLWFS